MAGSLRGHRTSSGTMKIEDIEPGLLRQRRNLLTISIGIIIFELGRGSLNSIPLGFGNVTLAKPDIALYLVWLALPYALWRYWLYREPAVAAFNTEIRNQINSLQKFGKLVSEVRGKQEEQKVIIENEHPLIKHGLFKRYLDFSVSIYASEKTGPNERKVITKEFQPVLIVPVSYFRVEAIELWAGILTFTTNRGFTDYYLPYLFAYFAGGLVVARHIF